MANPVTVTVVEKLVSTDTSASSLVVGGASPVATTGTGGINAGAIVGTSVADSVGTMATIRAGGIGIASQAAEDLILASSATQLKRLVKTNLGVLVTNGSGVASWLAGVASQYLRLNAGGTAFEMAAVDVPQIDITTSTFAKTTDTTLADVTGLSATVASSTNYIFRAVLYLSAMDSTGLAKVAIAGTATATAVFYAAHSLLGGTFAQGGISTALAGAVAVGSNNGGPECILIEGTITVNAGGTLTVQFAQAVANGTSTVGVGASWTVTKVV